MQDNLFSSLIFHLNLHQGFSVVVKQKNVDFVINLLQFIFFTFYYIIFPHNRASKITFNTQQLSYNTFDHVDLKRAFQIDLNIENNLIKY